MGMWIVLGDHRRARRLGDRDLQRPGRAAQPLQERVLADRRAAQAPLRPDPEPGRVGEGLHAARARDARRGGQGARQRGQRGAGARGQAGRSGGDAGPGAGRRRARRRARPAARGLRAVSRPQGEPERARAAGGAHQHREQGRVRAPGLQRLGDGVQHASASRSRTTLFAGLFGFGAGGAPAVDRVGRRAQGAEGLVPRSLDFFEQQERAAAPPAGSCSGTSSRWRSPWPSYAAVGALLVVAARRRHRGARGRRASSASRPTACGSSREGGARSPTCSARAYVDPERASPPSAAPQRRRGDGDRLGRPVPPVYVIATRTRSTPSPPATRRTKP